MDMVVRVDPLLTPTPTSCFLVSPLKPCTCPTGTKLYLCKHLVGLAILLKHYELTDKTRSKLLGKRRGKGRAKKVRSALLLSHIVNTGQFLAVNRGIYPNRRFTAVNCSDGSR